MADVSGGRSVAATPDERVVTSVEEIDALPRGTILLTAGQNPAAKSYKDGLWWIPLHDRPMPAHLMIGFRVIYSPPVGDTTQPTECNTRPDNVCHSTHADPVATQPQPTEEPIQRFGLTLTKAAFDKLGAALEVINEAERRALSGPDFVGAVAEIRALHAEKLDHHFHAGEFFSQCAACGPKVRYPCATVQAIDKAGC